MDVEIDMESTNVRYNSIQIKSEPTVYKMSTVNISTRAESGEQYPDNQAIDGQSNYKSDTESHKTVKNFENVDVHIKDEPNAFDASGYYSCNLAEATNQWSDHHTRNSGQKALHVQKENNSPQCYATNYAVCMKYEPNSCEGTVGSDMNTRCGVNLGRPYDQANDDDGTKDNSHCYENPYHAPYDVSNRDVQISCGSIKSDKRDILVSNIQKRRTVHSVPYFNVDTSVPTYHDHEQTNRTGNDEIQKSKYNVDIPESTNIKTCNVCSFSSVYSSTMAAHKQRHAELGEKAYKCDVCSYSTSRPCHLANHKRIHAEDMQYKCDICSYSVTSSVALGRHKRKHSLTGVFPYKCDICSCSFVWSGSLTRHKRKHTEEKPYKCDKCSFSTFWPWALARHKRKHTDKTEEKPYKCYICGYSTVQPGRFTRHKQKHTGGKP